MNPGERLLLHFLHHQTKVDEEGTHILFCKTNLILREDGELVSIEAPTPGQGDGTQALRHLIGMADVLDVTLTLYARAFDGRPYNTKRVIRWYERHGFTITGDNGLDWKATPNIVDEDHAGCDLIRLPKRT